MNLGGLQKAVRVVGGDRWDLNSSTMENSGISVNSGFVFKRVCLKGRTLSFRAAVFPGT